MGFEGGEGANGLFYLTSRLPPTWRAPFACTAATFHENQSFPLEERKRGLGDGRNFEVPTIYLSEKPLIKKGGGEEVWVTVTEKYEM